MKDKTVNIYRFKVILLMTTVIAVLIPSFAKAMPAWQSTYYHQPFQLVIILIILFRNRKEMFPGTSTTEISVSSVIVAIISAIMLIVSGRAGITGWIAIFLPALLWSSYAIHYGIKDSKRILFFIFMTALSFPYPDSVIYFFGYILQKGTLLFSYAVLLIMDWSTALNGISIRAFGYSLIIGMPCSGINSFIVLLPLLAIGIQHLNRSWKSAVKLFIILPFCIIFFNSIRVITIFIASPVINGKLDVEFFHQNGPVFFAFNAIFISFFLRRMKEREKKINAIVESSLPGSAYWLIFSIYFVTAVLLFFPSENILKPSIDTERIKSIFAKNDNWKIKSIESSGDQLLKLLLDYKNMTEVILIMGVVYKFDRTCPKKWCLQNPELDGVATVNFKREVIIRNMSISRWMSASDQSLCSSR